MSENAQTQESAEMAQIAPQNAHSLATQLQNESVLYQQWISGYAVLDGLLAAIATREISDENFTKFRNEIQKIFRGIGQVREHVGGLFQSYTDLSNEFIANYKHSDNRVDQDSLKILKQQIKSSEETLESSNKHEESAKSELRQLKHDIITLGATIKQGVGLSAAQERTINELVATKEQTTKELEAEMDKIVSLRNGLVSISERIEATELEKRQIEREISSLKEKNTAKKIEIDNEMRNKERLEQDLREQRVVVTIKSQEVVGKQDAVNRATEDIAIIESQIRQQRQMIEKLLRDQESLGTRTVKLQQDYDEQMNETTKLIHENETTLATLKQRETDLAHHKTDVKKVNLLTRCPS